MYSNLQGSAKRNNDKDIRVATHVPVVKECFVAVSPMFVIEHGMGNSSTALFHDLNTKKIISFEDDRCWQHCPKNCDGTAHEIHSWSIFELQNALSNVTVDQTIGFVDGPELQRYATLETLLNAKVRCVIEHDAETWSAESLTKRIELCNALDYKLVQYIGKNPETAVFAKSDIIEKLDLTQYITML